MKYFLILSLICSCFLLESQEPHTKTDMSTSPNQPLPQQRIETLLNANLKPTPALEKILELTDIFPHQSYQALLQETQEKWFLKGERWDHVENHKALKEQLMPLLDQAGVLEDIWAKEKEYDYALILGAIVYPVRKRLKCLIQEWQRGVRFKQIVFLAADWEHDSVRELERLKDLSDLTYPFKKNADLIQGEPKTEYDFMQCVWNQTDIPESMKEVEVIFVKSPPVLTAEGTYRRAWTEDTLREWLTTFHPRAGKCLCISSQPYIIAQDPLIRRVLPPSYQIETIGIAANPNLFISKHLDNLARAIFYEGQRKGIH